MMKKIFGFIITFFLFVTLLVNISVAEAGVNIKINNMKVYFPDAQPFIDENNRVLVPIRFVSELMGAKVEWEEEDLNVTIISPENLVVKFKIDSNIMIADDTKEIMDTKATLLNGRTYIPLRFCAKALKSEVLWDEVTRTADLSTKSPSLNERISTGASYSIAAMNKSDLINEAKVIVRGIIERAPPCQGSKNSAHTDILIKVIDIFKGEPYSNRIIIRNEMVYNTTFSDPYPNSVYGSEVILFLSKTYTDSSENLKYYLVKGVYQGVFSLSDKSKGEFTNGGEKIILENFRNEIRIELEKAKLNPKYKPTKEQTRQDNEKSVGLNNYNKTELIILSDIIVKGTVEKKLPSKWSNPGYEIGKHIYDEKGNLILNTLQTDFPIKVEDVFKGEYNDKNIMVRVDYGEDGDIVTSKEFYPDFKEGEEVILFLSKDVSMQANPNENYYILTGMCLGKYTLSDKTRGIFTSESQWHKLEDILIDSFKKEVESALQHSHLYPHFVDKNSCP